MAKNIKEITSEYSFKGLMLGGELYLRLGDALNFVKECEANNLAVIGIEGALMERNNLIPQIDKIYDASSSNSNSWEKYRGSVNNGALKFLENLSVTEGLYFTSVVISELEYMELK